MEREAIAAQQLHGDRIIADRQVCELLTGKLVQRGLTGQPVDWTWQRNYGCNTPLASQHLLLFRSGAAGYCDLTNDGGTGNFGGFRSSCTNNLIAAGGVLNIPEYTRTCTCDYQNQSSVALIHMPDVRGVWTEFPLSNQGAVQRLALNLGTPGFHRAEDGTLWINNFAGAQVEYDQPGYYCRHTSNIQGDGKLNWVAASGCRGIRRLTLNPGRKESATFTVRLHSLLRSRQQAKRPARCSTFLCKARWFLPASIQRSRPGEFCGRSSKNFAGYDSKPNSRLLTWSLRRIRHPRLGQRQRQF